jgi:hypothetical protein
MKNFILARLKEPSTWSALSVIGVMVGMPPGTMDLLQQIVLGGIGLAGVFLPESKA